jgi:16S rRNA (guanine527-N7)-methyltransferase
MIGNEMEARAFCAASVDDTGFSSLERLTRRLAEENGRQNLVAASSLDEVWRRHIADSLQLIDHVPRGTGTWLDLGSGAGFPGLVVAIACPQRPVVLIESRKLRVEWLRSAVEELALTNVDVLGSRLERAPAREAAVISARAFATLTKLLRLSARFSTPTTAWVLPKGRAAAQELQEQSPAVRRMFHVEQSLTDPYAGILIGQGVPDLR